MKKQVSVLRKLFICPTVSIIDFVEDKVRLRLLLTFPLIFIFCNAFMYLLQTHYNEKSIPSQLLDILSPSDYIKIGEKNSKISSL